MAMQAGPAQLVERLSVSTRRAFRIADALRQQVGQSEITIPHLLFGLYQKSGGETRTAFESVKLSEDEFIKLAELPHFDREALSAKSVEGTAEVDPNSFDHHVAAALLEAERIREAKKRRVIAAGILFEGILRVSDSPVVRRLLERGVRPVAPAAAETKQSAGPDVRPAAEGTAQSAVPPSATTEGGTPETTTAAETTPRPLLTVAGTAIAIARTGTPWTLGADAMSVPTSGAMGLEGGLAKRLRETLGEGPWSELAGHARAARESAGGFGPGAPLTLETPPAARSHGLPGRLFFATAFGADDRASPRHAARAAVELCRRSAASGGNSLAVPFIGTGEGDLEWKPVVAAMLRAIVAGAPYPGLRTVTLTTLRDGAIEFALSLLPELEVLARSSRRADLSSDKDLTFSQRDSLGMGPRARLFSRLLIDSEVKPPFAIGLFGNWGVGKTFFMGLIGEQIRELTGDPETAARLGVTPRVATIEFNAWHYADANLWASLATHIFDELARTLSPQAGRTSVEKKRAELRTELESSRRQRQEAEEAQAKAREQLQEASAELADLEKQRREASGKHLRALVAAVAGAARSEVTRETLDRQARKLGVAAALETVDDAAAALAAGRQVQARLTGLLRSLVSDFAGRAAWIAVPAAIIGAFAVMHLETIAGWLVDGAADFVSSSPTLIKLCSAAAALVTWGNLKIRSIEKFLGTLDRIVQKAKEKVDEDRDPELAKHKSTVEKLETQIRTQAERIGEAERRIATAEEEIQRIDSGGLVYDFLAERGRDTRYLEELGLVSIIRRDLEELHTLLEDWRKNGENSVDRIVLFVDDLDRCKPEQVVEVLQAVHLLLALPLFNVVVGVDPRWLERSLNEVYADRKSDGVNSSVFSAHNYLEKIFQIPFSLEGLRGDTFGTLVDRLVKTSTTGSGAGGSAAGRSPGDGRGAGDDGDDGGTEGAGAGERGDQPAAAAGGGDARRTEQEGGAGDVADGGPETDEKEDAVEAPPPQLLERHERDFMKLLSPFVVTPRLAKRFINLYRLLRLHAYENDFSAFVQRDEGEYRNVLVLLALITGYPQAGGKVLRLLVDRKAEVTAGAGDFLEFLRKVSEGLKPFETWLDERDREEAKKAYQDCLVAQAGLPRPEDAPEFPVELEPYTRWSPEVGRYSFYWHAEA